MLLPPCAHLCAGDDSDEAADTPQPASSVAEQSEKSTEASAAESPAQSEPDATASAQPPAADAVGREGAHSGDDAAAAGAERGELRAGSEEQLSDEAQAQLEFLRSVPVDIAQACGVHMDTLAGVVAEDARAGEVFVRRAHTYLQQRLALLAASQSPLDEALVTAEHDTFSQLGVSAGASAAARLRARVCAQYSHTRATRGGCRRLAHLP